MCLGVYLVVVVCASVTASGPPQNDKRVYYDVTQDVKVTVTPPTVYAGFTRYVELMCTFNRKSGSDFSTVQALIVSKTESDTKQYRELATITSKTGDDVEQGASLSATASGQVSATNGSFIKLKWNYPGMEIKGQYVCEGHGLDDKGHPRVSYDSVNINVIEKGIGNEMMLQKMQEMESRLDTYSARITELEAAKDESDKRFHQSKQSMIQYETSWGGHAYYLSRRVVLNTYISASLCNLYGGYLVEIDDKAEWDFVTNLTKTVLKDEAGPSGIMLGTTDDGHPGKWTFLRSGKPVTFFHWAPGHPAGGNEHCMHLWNPHDVMGDHVCETDPVLRFMCEFDFS